MDFVPNINALLPTAKSTSANAVKDEMSTIQTLDSISDKAIPILVQVAAIATIGSAGFLGPAAVALAGAGLMAFELGRSYLHNQADLNRELALYHKDIARVLGKSPNEHLTIKDMRNAADEKVVGDKALKPLKAELDHLKARARLNYAMSAGRALITTAVTGVMSMAMTNFSFHSFEAVAKQGMGIFYLITGSLGITSMANMGMEKLAWDNFDKTKPPTIYSDLVKLQKSAQLQPVRPQQVFEIILKSDKALATQIEQLTGQEYSEMTARNKERILAQYEKQTHVVELTEHLNNGSMGVTAIPLSVSGQLDWSKLPSLAEKPEMPTASPSQAQAKTGKFVAQLEKARGQLAETQLGLS